MDTYGNQLRSTVGRARWFHWAGLVLLLITVGLLAVIALRLTNNKTISGNVEVQQVVSRVDKHVLLPTNETPALATITDPSKLGGNSFLKQGKKGDKILIYAKWKRAVLYRPSIDRVIDIGPVDIASPDSSSGFQQLK